MTAQYAFYFDSRFCSGCKACQAACKDKNNLPTGVLWRRVVEVSGGTWQKDGDAWTNTVFAYNLSLSCNHCTYPKCAGVCPTKAYEKRADGIVFLDTSKCIGCGYCAWACSYEVPQYNPEAGHMTKCDFCLDYLEQGLSPACVAACPLRVLDYGEMTIQEDTLCLWQAPAGAHPYPLPSRSRSEPHLALMPHAAMHSSEEKHVANREEIRPRRPSTWEELPLFLFTLLAQLAVGSFWAMTWMFPILWLLVEYDSTTLRLLPSVVIGISLGVSVMASFAHLGTKRNAWRVLANLRKSWLSREVLFLSLFGASWLITTFHNLTRFSDSYELSAVTSILGIGLIYSMSQVYRFPAAPGWNSWRTNASFLISALVLGISSMTPLLAFESSVTGVQVPTSRWMIVGGCIFLLLLAQLIMMYTQPLSHTLQNARIVLLLAGIIISASGFFQSYWNMTWFGIVVFFIVAIEECVGRWLFYSTRLVDAKEEAKV